MAMERNIKILAEIAKRPGNETCADCGSKELQYASYNIGIFLCAQCASVHNQMGSHISKVKHLQLDHWEDSQIERLKQVGNNAAKNKYEQRIPTSYRRPRPTGDDPPILVEQWILSKYLREEFTEVDKQLSYLKGEMEGFLWKKGREDPRFFPRKFVLDSKEVRYYVKEHKSPKAEIPLLDLSMTLAPEKLGDQYKLANGSPVRKQTSIQLSFLKDGSTRHIYVYHDDPEIVVQWYQALRIAMFRMFKTEYPLISDSLLLPQDALMEGWLWKAGPGPSYAHRRRWFTLNQRKLMYHIDPVDAYAKGEIFLGSCHEAPYGSQEEFEKAAAKVGVTNIKNLYAFGSYKISMGGFGMDKVDSSRHVFSLHTPYRTFVFASESYSERDRWVERIKEVLNMELTLKDIVLCAKLVRKRANGMNPISLLTGR